MRYLLKALSVIILIGFFTGSTIPARADRIPEPWQSQREASNKIGDKACAGDNNAIIEIKRRIDEGDPVHMSNTGWLRSNCEAFKDLKAEEVAEYQKRAALMGYPIAISNYGSRLIYGDSTGVNKDIQLGIRMKERAAKEGYGLAASELAGYYISGKYFERDLQKAREFLAIAQAEDVSIKTLSKVSENLATAEAETSASNSSSIAENGEQFAALAVSLADGGFGFAHDYPDAESARERARSECESRGGADCDVKMIGQGKGCMAYNAAGGSATAHGWAIGPTRNVVETRAAQECQKRNGNAVCGNTSWVCNDRTQAPLKTVFNAPMPEVKQTVAVGPGPSCYFYAFYHCDQPGGKKIGTRFYYDSFDYGRKIKIPGAESCKSWKKANGGGLIYRDFNNKIFNRPQAYQPHEDRFQKIIRNLKAEADRKMPGCVPYLGLDIVVGSENKTSVSKKYRDRLTEEGKRAYFFIDAES